MNAAAELVLDLAPAPTGVRKDIGEPEGRSAVTTMEVISRALAANTDFNVVARLMELHERWEATQARKAFDAAIASAKAEIPPIIKNRHVGFASKNGGARTDYKHEDLAEIARTVDPILGKYGLSYRYETEQAPNAVTVSCILAHRDGHFTRTSLTAGHDNSGNKNSIQAVGSTITYLQRYTLKAALGLSASHDDDGKAAGGEEDAYLSDDQQQDLQDLIIQTGADPVALLKYLKVDTLKDIYVSRLEDVKKIILSKRGRA
ncbi:ERF family protein [Hyphomicrobiales bacterium]|nr:ERF family protein [Hyphomicrobiales bacterium]CAH1663829.1 ERF family protein [Hyphomicrobiales bacterium]